MIGQIVTPKPDKTMACERDFSREARRETGLSSSVSVSRPVPGDCPMDAAPSSHPTRQALTSFGKGKLDNRLADAVKQHLVRCPDCWKQVTEMSTDNFLGRVREAEATDHFDPAKSPVYRSQSLERSTAATPIPAHTLPRGLDDHPDYEIKRQTRPRRHGRGLPGPQQIDGP